MGVNLVMLVPCSSAHGMTQAVRCSLLELCEVVQVHLEATRFCQEVWSDNIIARDGK